MSKGHPSKKQEEGFERGDKGLKDSICSYFSTIDPGCIT